MVKIESLTKMGLYSWKVKYSSDLEDPTFRIFLDGALIAETQATEHIIAVIIDEGSVIEILDDPVAQPMQIFPGRVRLGWFFVEGTDYYRIDEYINGEWIERYRMPENDGYMSWKSRFLEDGQTHQFRVMPVGTNGNEGTPREFAVLMCRRPDVPDVNFSYDEGAQKVIVSDPDGPPENFNFTPYPGNPIMQPGGWEGTALAEPSVIFEDGIFKMWYRAAGGIGYATSEDGISFSKYEGNPVLTAEEGIAYPYVLKINSTYYLYAGKVSIGSIYRWSSADGITWNIDNGGNPVLEVATSGWDEGRTLYNTSVYYNESINPKWRMLYEAAGIIGYAYSDDGLNWTRYGNYVIGPTGGGVDDWRGNGVYTPSNIIKRGDYYYVWYGGENGWMDPWEPRIYSIGCAYSKDFINWTDASNCPVLSPVEPWESFGIGDACVVFYSGKAHEIYLFYGGGTSNEISDLGLAYCD